MLKDYFKSVTALRMGIDNYNAPTDVIVNLTKLDRYVYQRLIELFADASIHITSGYRCPTLNKAVGGVANSQHLKGQAMDIKCDSKYWQDLCKYLQHNTGYVSYDQCIVYAKSLFIHISYVSPEANRHQYIILDK